MHSPVKESILYTRASDHYLRFGRGQLNYPTLSGPWRVICDWIPLHKLYLAQNAAYLNLISLTTLHTSATGLYALIGRGLTHRYSIQYVYMSIFFSHTVATICLRYFRRIFPFNRSQTFCGHLCPSSSFNFCVTCLHLFSFLTSYLYR